MTQEQIFPSPQTMSLTKKPKKERLFKVAQHILRVLVLLFTLVATIITLKSDQKVKMGEETIFQASYSYSFAMRFQLKANIVVGVLSFLSVMFVCLFTSPKCNVNNYFYIFLYDLVLLLMITSGCIAGTFIGMVALRGELKIGWGPICNTFPNFCRKISLAIAFSYLALGCMFILTIMAVSKLRS